MKVCNRCKLSKSLSEFYNHPLSKDGYEPRCKVCKVEVAKLHKRSWKIQAVEERGGCCEKCGGIFHPCVYDFHHTRDDKDFNPGKTNSKKSFFNEISKCIMVCANCHRMLHYA